MDKLCIEQRLIDAVVKAVREECGVHSCTDGPTPESFTDAALPAAWISETAYDLRVGEICFDPLLFPLLTMEIVLAYPCKREGYERDGRRYRAAIESAMYRDETFGGLAVQSTYQGAVIGASEQPGTGMVISTWQIEYQRLRKNPYKRHMEE